jgi:hypothetical protein
MARDTVGLCARCRHARVVGTPRSLFWRCARAEADGAYAKYPPLPVIECRGHEPGEPRATAAPPEPVRDETG